MDKKQAEKELKYQIKQAQIVLDFYCRYRKLKSKELNIEYSNIKSIYVPGLGYVEL